MRPAVIAAAVIALAGAGAAAAQTYPRPATQPGYGDDRPERPEAAERPERPEAPEAGDPSQDLVRQLGLRGDQQAAFRDYQAAFQEQTQDKESAQDDVARLAAMTTPQRLDDSLRQMDRDRADFERVAAATRRFYATLDSGQKRTFDRLTAPQAEPDDGGMGDDDAPGSTRAPAPQR